MAYIKMNSQTTHRNIPNHYPLFVLHLHKVRNASQSSELIKDEQQTAEMFSSIVFNEEFQTPAVLLILFW